MKAFLSLCRLMLKVFFGFVRRGGQKDWKRRLKNVGIAALILYGVGAVSAAFIAVNMTNYVAFKPIGLQGLMVLNNLVLISLVSFVFGLITAMSIYFQSDAEIGFLALPLRPWQMFSAKMVVVYISEVFISVMIMLPMLIIFGVKEHPPLQFYIYGVIGSLALPLVPICLMFFILVPLVRVFRFLRRRNTLFMLAGIIGISFTLAFQLYYQNNLMHINDPSWLRSNYTGSESFLAGIGGIYPPAFMLWRSLTASGMFEGISYLVALLGISVLAVFVTVGVLSGAFRNSLVGFNEMALKKLRDAGKFIRKKFRQRPVFFRLLGREIKLMNREPVYFFNGPFIMILLPAIMLISYFFLGKSMSDQLGGKTLDELLVSVAGLPFSVFICGAIGGFLGSATLITPTAFSRDAKFMAQIKSLPVPAAQYGMIKLVHGLLFGVIGIIIGTVPLLFLFRMGLWPSLLALLLAASIVWLLNISGLYLDTAFPKLHWDSTLAAFKNNPNALAGVFGAMIFIGMLGTAAWFLKIGWIGYLLACALMLAAAVRLTMKYPSFAGKRISLLEV